MENNSRMDGKSKHNTHERNTKHQNRASSPKGFEGMNFEQQRGSYKNSDGGRIPDDEGGKSLTRQGNQ